MAEWMNNRFHDGDWNGEKFSTREEAIEDGIKQHAAALHGCGTDLFDDDDEHGHIPSVFYVGRVAQWHPSVDGSCLIESAQEQACDEGGEYGEGFLCDVIREQEEELTELVQRVFDDWFVRNRLWKFFLIEDTEEIRVGDQGEGQ